MTNQRKTPIERDFQNAYVNILQRQGFVKRPTKAFDKHACIDTEMFLAYIKNTQQDAYDALHAQYREFDDKQLEAFIVDEYVKSVDSQGLAHVLSHGFYIEDSHDFHFDITCPRPSSTENHNVWERYEKNTYSVIEELYIDDDNNERIDLCLFRNGVLYAMIELKYTKAGQNVKDAVKQWKQDRQSGCRAMRANIGCLVYIAQDDDEVYFTTDVQKRDFLPFNEGSNKASGDIRDIGAGNDLNTNLGYTYKTQYMPEKVFAPSSFDYIFDKMVLSEIKDEPVFPRFHQLNTVRTIDDITRPLADTADTKYESKQIRFLTQQAPGAGKTLEIAWASILLAGLTDPNTIPVYDKVVIITDRIAAVKNIADDLQEAGNVGSGFVEYAEEGSQSLVDATKGSSRIVVSSAQKFLHKGDVIAAFNADRNVRYAVFIDEAHDNTEGQNQADIMGALTGVECVYGAVACANKRANIVDFFAFTATPKPTTMQAFGCLNDDGSYAPHTVYSMRQAIQERFIIDVLANVFPVQTIHVADKAVEEDPMYQSSQAKRAIQTKAESDWDFIRYTRIPSIVEHWRSEVDGKLFGGKEKALVICAGKQNAVRYKKAFDEYCQEMLEQGLKGYNIKAHVAFSGAVVDDDGNKQTEHSLNPDVKGDIGDAYEKDDAKFLFVANKYQQAYDLPALCAGYICKHIGSNIHLVQAYGRFNRMAFTDDGMQKKTVIVDYNNAWDEICAAHEPFYATFGEQPKGGKSLADAYRDVMNMGLIREDQLQSYKAYFMAKQTGADESVLAAIQGATFDRPVDDVYTAYDLLDDKTKTRCKEDHDGIPRRVHAAANH